MAKTQHLLFATAAVLTACAPAQRHEPFSDWSIESAKVVFTGRRGGVSDLYVFDRASGDTTRVTSLGTAERGVNAARVSRRSGRLAFQVRRGSDYEIHVMDQSSGRSRNVTKHPEYDVSPVWSPDGGQLAFMSTRGFELGSLGPFPGHIYVLSLDSQALEPVTREPLTSSLGPSDWSADGARLLLARVSDQAPDIYELDLTTGAERRLTDSPQGEYSPRYSHSGQLIAFHSESDDSAQIVVLDLQTGELRAVTAGPGLRYYPKWSPNDEWLLFTASDDGQQYDLRAVRVSDGATIELVATAEDEREGEWWPW